MFTGTCSRDGGGDEARLNGRTAPSAQRHRPHGRARPSCERALECMDDRRQRTASLGSAVDVDVDVAEAPAGTVAGSR